MKAIIFNTEMVQAILDDRKTMTRRVVKNGKRTPLTDGRDKFYKIDENLNGENPNRLYAGFYKDSDVFESNGKTLIDALYYPLYFKVGDILWVRETWLKTNPHDCTCYECYGNCMPEYVYRADDIGGGDGYKWRPSIHMPKKAARIFLKVTGVRVERVQEISWQDALSEGIWHSSQEFREQTLTWRDCAYALQKLRIEYFAKLWDSIYSAKGYGWESNPWVWVIEFERVDANGSKE